MVKIIIMDPNKFHIISVIYALLSVSADVYIVYYIKTYSIDCDILCMLLFIILYFARPNIEEEKKYMFWRWMIFIIGVMSYAIWTVYDMIKITDYQAIQYIVINTIKILFGCILTIKYTFIFAYLVSKQDSDYQKIDYSNTL